MSTYYLTIVDEEIEDAGSQISKILSLTENAIGQYRSILTTLSQNAVISGKVHDALIVYDEYIEKLEDTANQLGDSFTKLTKGYISETESADSYLYDAGIPDTVRNFSENQYERLLKCLDNPWCDFTDSIGDWLYGKVKWLVDLIDWKGAQKHLNQSYKSLLDYNDETKQGLTLLFDEVHGIDSRFGDSGSGSLSSLLDTAKCLSELLVVMAEIISPQSTIHFTAESIRAHAGGKFQELQDRLGKALAVSDTDRDLTIGEISDFCSQPWASLYFSSFSQAFTMFLGDIGALDAAGMVVFNMFDITESNITHSDDMTYDQRRAKEELLELLEKMGTESLYKGTEYEATLDECKLFVKYIKKYGKGIYDWLNTHRMDNGKLILDGRTVEARKFREFLGSVGNVATILKYGEEGIEYIARLFADYSKSNEILSSFISNCSDPEMGKAAEEIQALFNKEFNAWSHEAIDKASELGWDLAVKGMSKATPVMAVVSTIRLTLDLGGGITGAGTHAKNKLDALTYHNIHCASSSAYMNAIAKLREADPNSEEYEALCKDASNCFEITKQNLIKMFKAMEAASTGNKSSYYRYCSKQAENLSMSDIEKPDIMSYEEFLNVSHV